MTKNTGEILQKARKDKGLSLQSISSQLFIRVHYLEAIENNEFHLIPSQAQLIGFIRAYADFLELDSNELISSLSEKTEEVHIPEIEFEAQDLDTANIIRSKQIYADIGKELKETREKLGISIDNVTSFTHINPNSLEAIEEGDINQFSSAAQARGMIRNYSDFLGLETDRILVRFAEAIQSRIGIQPSETEEPPPEDANEHIEKRQSFKLRDLISLDMVVFGIVGAMIVIFLFWGVGRVLRLQTEQEPEATSAEVVEAEQTESPDVINGNEDISNAGETDIQATAEDINSSIPTIQVAPGDSISINVIASIRAYLRVTVDGEVKFDGRVIGGSNLAYSGQESIEVLTGNGAAIEIIFNSISLGQMGIFGERIHSVYSSEGIVIPTPQPLDGITLPDIND